MKIRRPSLCWIAFLLGGLALVGEPVYAADPGVDALKASLEKGGFKCNLSDFNLAVSPETKARTQVIETAFPNGAFSSSVNSPNLLEHFGSNAAVVVWRQSDIKKSMVSQPEELPQITWEEFEKAVAGKDATADNVCRAILSGPLHFDFARSMQGAPMLLPHLARFKVVQDALGDRLAIDLREEKWAAAWTNVVATTRLATAWEIEPVEVSHRVRFKNVETAFAALWQALQTNVWSDQQLAALQTEWESVNFFTNLPDVEAFHRATDLNLCVEMLAEVPAHLPPSAFKTGELQPPAEAWETFQEVQRLQNYSLDNITADEKAVLQFYRDREAECRQAIKAATWKAMRTLPEVTNSSATIVTRTPKLTAALRFQRQQSRPGAEPGLLAEAAVAETYRRLIVTALGLARFQKKQGHYPEKLNELVPEFLPHRAVDFMDGKLLRYRTTPDGEFILYSVGLNGTDNGGRYEDATSNRENAFLRRLREIDSGCILWPRPAPVSEVEAARTRETKEWENRVEATQTSEAKSEWMTSDHHQADVEKLLAAKLPVLSDIMIDGKPLSEILANPRTLGTNKPPLGELFALKQVHTGDEPETITFELPIKCSVATNLGQLTLSVDTNNDESDLGDQARVVQCVEATNGNCRFIWNTIYESPGKHAVQAVLGFGGRPVARGPYYLVTITNFCQFDLASSTFEFDSGAIFRGRLPEKNGSYVADMLTTNGVLLKTFHGATTNGMFHFRWDLIDSKGKRFTNEVFNSVFHITLPDSGRKQTLRGP